MLTSVSETMVAIGHARQSDAFQSGREAAQMAKNQLSEASCDFALILAPDNFHFQSFVEGARLVVREDRLLCVPCARVFYDGAYAPETALVVMVHSSSNLFSVTGVTYHDGSHLSAVTCLLSNFRNQRRNAAAQHPHRNILLFENTPGRKTLPLSCRTAADVSLETFFMGVNPSFSNPVPMIFRDQAIHAGVAGVECLSNEPWQVTKVDVGEIAGGSRVYADAARSALRDCQLRLKGEAAMGFLFFNMFSEAGALVAEELCQSARSVMGDVPILCVSTESLYLRTPNYPATPSVEAVVAVLIPK